MKFTKNQINILTVSGMHSNGYIYVKRGNNNHLDIEELAEQLRVSKGDGIFLSIHANKISGQEFDAELYKYTKDSLKYFGKRNGEVYFGDSKKYYIYNNNKMIETSLEYVKNSLNNFNIKQYTITCCDIRECEEMIKNEGKLIEHEMALPDGYIY